MVYFGFWASMGIKVVFRHQLVAVYANTLATRTPLGFHSWCMITHDVGRIHINQIIATFGRAFKKQFFLFRLLFHEGKIKIFFNDIVPLQKRHCFAIDATIDWLLFFGRTCLTHGAKSREFTWHQNLFQMSLNAFDAKKVGAAGTDAKFRWVTPTNCTQFVVLVKCFCLVPCLKTVGVAIFCFTAFRFTTCDNNTRRFGRGEHRTVHDILQYSTCGQSRSSTDPTSIQTRVWSIAVFVRRSRGNTQHVAV